MTAAARSLALKLAARKPVTPPSCASNEVLLLRPDHLGDVLLLGPALQRFRRIVPDARVTLLVGPWSGDVAAHLPGIDEIVRIPFPGFDRSARHAPAASYRLLGTWARALRRRAPIAAVILRDDHWWGAWLAKHAGIPIRVGADLPVVRDFLTHPVALTRPHVVEHNVALLDATARALGGEPLARPPTAVTDPLIWKTDADATAGANDLLAELGVAERFITIHPGAGAVVKRWPAARWAAVASRLSTATNTPVVFTGSADEAPLIAGIQSAMTTPSVSLAGQTPIALLAEVYRRAAVVLGPDSGPLHLAVAAGAPTVRLYGPSDPARFGPWGIERRNRAIHAGFHCRRCGDLSAKRPEGAGCMLAICEETVLEAAVSVLCDG